MDAVATTAGRVTPWNKGKLFGQDARGPKTRASKARAATR